MPTYDYKCEDCGNIFEIFKSITDESIPECPSCNSLNVKKQISAGSGIIFKGSGFYVTDYKNEKSNGNSTAKNTAGKSENKPGSKE